MDKSNTVLVPFSGSGSSQVTASLGSQTLDFGTMKFCDQKQLQTTLNNGPCGIIKISRLQVLTGTPDETEPRLIVRGCESPIDARADGQYRRLASVAPVLLRHSGRVGEVVRQ